MSDFSEIFFKMQVISVGFRMVDVWVLGSGIWAAGDAGRSSGLESYTFFQVIN
jgi:hypothetical protein